jgi:glycosyltransferase involved in cell wall biosynthesis
MKKILMISELSYKPVKVFQGHRLDKGFIRCGNDVKVFDYAGEISKLSPFKSKKLSKLLYGKKAVGVLCKFCKHYKPDYIFVNFSKFIGPETITRIRESAEGAKLIGMDGDPWPKLHPERIAIAKELDMVFATNDGQWLQDYQDVGVPFTCFIPNCCDPDIEHRYEVEEKWKSDILWIGTIQHSVNTGSTFREELIARLARLPNSRLYACLGRPKIGGIDCIYAMSGAKIGLSVSASEPVKLYDSDRLVRLLSCGAFVLARRFPDCDLLFEDGKHLRYFDKIEEFFELADWYLKNERERKRISDAGMARAHEQFSCEKIAGYVLELAEHGRYSAPWFSSLSTADQDG